MTLQPPQTSAAPRHRKRYYTLVGAMLFAVVGWWGWRAYRAAPLEALPPLDLSQAHGAVKTTIERELAAVRAAPRSGRAWGRLGVVLRAHEFGAQANTCLAVAGRLDPREFLWPYIEGVSQALIDPEKAIGAFRRAAALRPLDPLPHYRLGELLLQQGRTDEAGPEFEQGLALEPDSARGHLGLARCALIKGDLPLCKRLAAQAARLSPRQRAAHELFAQVCHRLRDDEEAQRTHKVLEQLPAGETTWNDPYVAQVLELRRDPRRTAEAAQALLDEGRGEEAILLSDELVNADDADPRWKVMLAQSLIATADYARAATVIERGIVRHPDSTDLRLQLGILAFREQKWTNAAIAFREAVRLKPDSSQAFYNLGHALRQLDDAPGASDAFREAIRFQPNLAAAHANLGELLVQSGRRDEGLSHLRLAVMLDPSDALARRALKQAGED